MRKTKSLVALALVAALFPATSSIGAPKAPATPAVENGWLLKQRMDYHGIIEVTASPAGAKLKTRSLTVFMSPTSTSAVLLNEAKKTETLVDKKVWLDQGTMSGLVKVVPPAICKQFKVPMKPPRMIAGHKCTQHWAAAYRHDHSFWFWWEFWTTTDIKLPRTMTDQWLAMMHLPSGEGLPLEATRHMHINKSSHKEIKFLITNEAKQIKVATADVTPPKGYKKVGDELDMVLGGEEKEDDEVSRLLGGSGPSTKKK